jgi:hypothetical protein
MAMARKAGEVMDMTRKTGVVMAMARKAGEVMDMTRKTGVVMAMTRKITVVMAMTRGMARQTGVNEEQHTHFSIKHVQTRFGNRKCFRTIMCG